MAIDQRNISAELRMMDDRALQQYAAMHKADPYIFPLAFQESQNRQALRMGKTAQMAGQTPPKVADAALMAMTPTAPEEMGIGRLPAPNIQRMADGGIAGFDESTNAPVTTQNLNNMGNTGGMFNYAHDGGGVMRLAAGGMPGYKGPTDGEDADQVVDEFAGVDDQIAANLEQRKLAGAFDDYSQYKPTPKLKKASKTDKKEAAKEAPAPLPTYTPKTAEQIRATADVMAKPELEEIQNTYKPFAEQFAQDRSRIEDREKSNLSNSLIRAGLGMIGGKSQFAGVNIGEGGIQGLNAYQEAEKANDAARRALMQSEMQMAAAQRAERSGARKDAVTLTHEAERSQQMAVQFGQKAKEIENSEAYQKVMGAAATTTANAAMLRAGALNAAAGEKGVLTPKDIAALRDKALDNVKSKSSYNSDLITAKRAAMTAGKPFDEKAWLEEQITNEFNRLTAGLQTGRGVSIMNPAPTGGKLGSGTFDPTRWGNLEVVTPK